MSKSKRINFSSFMSVGGFKTRSLLSGSRILLPKQKWLAILISGNNDLHCYY